MKVVKGWGNAKEYSETRIDRTMKGYGTDQEGDETP